MNNLVIGTGWYSNGISHNKGVSNKCYQPNWLNIWREYHQKQSDEYINFTVYVSRCNIWPTKKFIDQFSASAVSLIENDRFNTRHDSWSAMLHGAIQAYNNDCDFVYIEQDCFVKGLQGATVWAKANKAKICYGFGEYAMQPNSAEYSFVYVDKKYIGDFISGIVTVCPDRQANILPERAFHMMFGEEFTAWPFGYGRKTVKNWDEPIFYKQQLTDEELRRFLNE